MATTRPFGRRWAREPVSRTPPQALGCPVKEKLVAPGRQIWPVMSKHALNALIDAHAPQTHGSGRLSKKPGGLINLFNRNLANFRRLFGAELFKERFIFFKCRWLALEIDKIDMPLPEARIVKLFVDYNPCHTMHES